MDATWVNTFAAIATAVSAAVIAWQAWETRKSAGAAKRAAVAAEEALRLANSSLELNRRQVGLSRLVANESIRMRLDASAASVSLGFQDDSKEGPRPFCYAISDKHGADSLELVQPGHVLQDPQDSEQWLWLIFRVAFRNMGATPVSIDCTTFYTAKQGVDRVSGKLATFNLPTLKDSREGVQGYLAVGNRASEWFYVFDQPQQERQHAISGEASWATVLRAETGAVESQEIKIRGACLGPGARDGDRTLRDFGPDDNYPSRLEARKQKRLYLLPEDRLLEDEKEAEGST